LGSVTLIADAFWLVSIKKRILLQPPHPPPVLQLQVGGPALRDMLSGPFRFVSNVTAPSSLNAASGKKVRVTSLTPILSRSSINPRKGGRIAFQ
jgi:hypothetical protein